jgi:hypothetical protein
MKQTLSFALIFLILGCHQTDERKQLAGIASLPHLKMLAMDSSTRLLPDDAPAGCPVILMYFDPECEHCVKETGDLMQHLAELKPAKVYMVSNTTSHESLQAFYQKNHLNRSEGIFFGEDYNYSFFRLYKPTTVPYIAIYNSKKRLVKIYQGETNVNSIIASARE